ncbi:hypothetical protein [Chitinophaga nivalis]|uniref:DUF4595 domain-containing protein n=1 Tax=Chitinophaga nivalis TaxID=2991709 RepID=A0ABT3IQZ9_9BACT|nr:hypothetical protein [Chitinophaga nivalis]MCW3463919.1 hypothetical protein [Chitinophaga nivalis]MCW3486391.1 hypothetical protein [Chitinophaga nivalis]
MKKHPLSIHICLLLICVAAQFTACNKTVSPLPVSGTASSTVKAPIWLLTRVVKTGPDYQFEKTFFYNAQHQLIRAERKPKDSSYPQPKTQYFTYDSNGLLSYVVTNIQKDTIFLQYDTQNRLIAHSPVRQWNTTLYHFNYYYKGNNTIGVTYYHNQIIMVAQAASYRKEFVYDAAGNIIKTLSTSRTFFFGNPTAVPDTSQIPTERILTYDNHPNFSRALQGNGPGILLAVELGSDNGEYFPVLPVNNISDDGFYYYRYTYNKDGLVQQANVYTKYNNALVASARFEYTRI